MYCKMIGLCQNGGPEAKKKKIILYIWNCDYGTIPHLWYKNVKKLLKNALTLKCPGLGFGVNMEEEYYPVWNSY